MIDPTKKPSERAMIDLFEMQSAKLSEMVSEYYSGKHAALPWKVVPAARLARIWKDAAREGFVRDVKGLERIEATFVENVVKLMVTTEISGHSTVSPEDVLEEHFAPEEIEAFVEWAIETPTGAWRISDYGLDPLVRLAALASDTADPSEKLVILDMMLNVIHQRSDLASWLVEGGRTTLWQLFKEGERPTDAFELAGATCRPG